MCPWGGYGMFVLVLALAAGAPNPATLVAPRKAYVACLKTFETKSASDKLTPEAYAEAIKTACPSEKTAFMGALVSFDVGMGTKRAAAEANAKRDVEDYWVESQERFKDR